MGNSFGYGDIAMEPTANECDLPGVHWAKVK
jgi:hypothetical protein